MLGMGALRWAPAPAFEPSVRKPFDDTYAVVEVWPKRLTGKPIASVANPSSTPAPVSLVPGVTSTDVNGASWHV